ncbi:MAG: metallophosphoesterase [Candidatus Choladocola sp.]|nr:metallophosphoesterase [Candidatus Choladocola sp.]
MPEFKVTRYKMRIGNEHRRPEQPFSVVFLSDLHNMSYAEGNSLLLQEIRNENPAFICVAGDMLIGGKEPQMDAALALMDELTKQYPVYYANGNHESRMKERPELYGDCYERYSNMIKSFGVHLLENSHAKTEIQRMPVTIWGLELPSEYFSRGRKRELTAEEMEQFLGRPEDDSFHLLLAHNPCYFDAYASWGADLTLSGHLHGGIVRLPFLGGVISPQVRLFPKYDRGMYTESDRKMIVSAGLGNHTINVRINNPPELIVIDFI